MALAACAHAGVASAGIVYVNSSQLSPSAIDDSVFTAKYRLSNSNFDQSLDNGTGTNSGTFVSKNLGNNNQLKTREYLFRLDHRVGQGFIFSMTNGTSSSTLAWGSGFSPGLPAGAGVAALLGGEAPGGAFNALLLEARAQRSSPTSFVTFSDIVFSSPTLTLGDGAFNSGSITNTMTGTTTLAFTPEVGRSEQWLVSDGNLAMHDWSLSALVRGSRDNAASGDELVRYSVAGMQVQTIPQPGTIVLAGLAFTLLLRRRA